MHACSIFRNRLIWIMISLAEARRDSATSESVATTLEPADQLQVPKLEDNPIGNGLSKPPPVGYSGSNLLQSNQSFEDKAPAVLPEVESFDATAAQKGTNRVHDKPAQA